MATSTATKPKPRGAFAPPSFPLVTGVELPKKRQQLIDALRGFTSLMAGQFPSPASEWITGAEKAGEAFGARLVSARSGEEAAKAAASAIANPAEQVANDFGGGAGTTVETTSAGGMAIGPPPDFSQAALPAPQITAGQIPGMYAGLLQQMQGEAPPLGRPEPAEYSPAQTFLSTFAGILGTQMARNPAIQENILNKLGEREQRRQAIEDQNYANRLLFDTEKRNRLVALRGKILEDQIATALSQGNAEVARIAAQNLEKLRGEHQAYVEKIRQAGELQRTRITVNARGEAGGTKPKPLTMNEYLDNLRNIQSAKPEQFKEVGGWFGGKALPKEDAMLVVHAAAALGGDTAAVQNLGFRRLVEGVKAKFKVKAKLRPEQAAKIAGTLLKDYSLPPKIVDQVLGEFEQ